MKAITAVSLLSLTLFAQAPQRDYPVKPVPFTAVHVNDVFWAPRIETNRKVTIPFAFQKDEETGRVDLFIRAAKGVVRVEITDPDDRLPSMAAPDPDALGGRGLIIVNGLASAWGVEPTTKGGKTVWFELSPLGHHGLE